MFLREVTRQVRLAAAKLRPSACLFAWLEAASWIEHHSSHRRDHNRTFSALQQREERYFPRSGLKKAHGEPRTFLFRLILRDRGRRLTMLGQQPQRAMPDHRKLGLHLRQPSFVDRSSFHDQRKAGRKPCQHLGVGTLKIRIQSNTCFPLSRSQIILPESTSGSKIQAMIAWIILPCSFHARMEVCAPRRGWTIDGQAGVTSVFLHYS